MKKTSAMVVVSLVMGCTTAMAQTSYSNAPTMSDLSAIRQTDISQSNYQAIQALRQMEDFILSLKRFNVTAQTSLDVVLENGVNVQLNNNLLLKIDRPNKLYAKLDNGNTVREVFYNGKQLTLYAPKEARYFTDTDAPADLNTLFTALRQQYGIRLPILDMIYSGNPSDPNAFRSIEQAYYLGDTLIDGVLCRHYTYHHPDYDFQVWIEKGTSTLPKKLTITDLKAPGAPRYSAVMTWNQSPSTSNRTFTFKAPRNATPIVVEEIVIQNNTYNN